MPTSAINTADRIFDALPEDAFLTAIVIGKHPSQDGPASFFLWMGPDNVNAYNQPGATILTGQMQVDASDPFRLPVSIDIPAGCALNIETDAVRGWVEYEVVQAQT